MVSLVDWHRRIHGVTGAIALRWCRATAEDLADWAQELRAVAAAMEAASAGQPPPAVAEPSSDIPDWLLETTADQGATNRAQTRD
jgi:hypothetical protein